MHPTFIHCFDLRLHGLLTLLAAAVTPIDGGKCRSHAGGAIGQLQLQD